MMKRKLLAIALVALLAGCGSSVKLDDVPVEDKSGTSVNAPGGGAAAGNQTGTGAAQSNVASVDLSKTGQDAAGPAGAARVIYFDYDSFVIKPEFQSVLDAHARYLKANSGRKAAIEGHTDERGGREYNLALGQKRSEAVRRALGLLGVTDSQIEAVSFGKEKPADAGMDEAAFAKNRRAEIAYR
jgi:peptidoglycan-associated lipoprotein